VARVQDALSALEDIREYDVPYHVRFAIDRDVRASQWYTASAVEGHVSLAPRKDLIFRGEPRICAFDIETTKLPLHFPNSEHDQVFMISYMLDKQGYLIVNRKVVGADIDAFEYTPKPEFAGPFEVFNEADEKATLERWFSHMREASHHHLWLQR
jgi:DNA polymerase epsilon subunit 1